MTRYAALLRGINLGARNKLAMPLLREIAETLGYVDPVTYLQSGNLAITTRRAAGTVAAELHGAIADRTGLDVPVVVRSHAELAAAVAANPLPEPADPSRFFVTFCERPAAGVLDGLDLPSYLPEEVAVVGREIYAWLPDGLHVARLTHALWERRTKGIATTRNWRTTLAMAELTS
jgi:uncharacterized protein (DUF1697 family)